MLDYANIIACAIICHEANRAYCASLGDFSQLPWVDAPDWQKVSAMDGVTFILENFEAPPAASHDNWTAQKLADGWVWGEVKDENAKTHPCLVPFDQLPSEQQAKDYIFGGVVRAYVESSARAVSAFGQVVGDTEGQDPQPIPTRAPDAGEPAHLSVRGPIDRPPRAKE